MFRVLVREIGRLFITLVALVGAGVVLAVSSGDSRTFGSLWSRLPGLVAAASHGEAAAVSALVRLGAYAVVAFLALSLVGRVVGDALFARRRGYSLPAHLAQLLRLRAVRLGAAVWGVILAVAQGGIAGASVGAPSRSLGASGGARVTMTTVTPTPMEEQAPMPRTASVPRDTGPNGTVVHRSRGGRVVVTRILRVMALRYTVQPGDTLGDIAYRLNPGDLMLSTRIFRLSRGLPQHGLPPITDPNLIFPGQTLRVPLPLPEVSVADGHIQVQAQPGDTEGAIAARLLGDWRRYPELTPLRTAVPHPDQIPNGLVLQLPASATVVDIQVTRRYVARLRPAARGARHGHGGRRASSARRLRVAPRPGSGASPAPAHVWTRVRASHPIPGTAGPRVHPGGHGHATRRVRPRRGVVPVRHTAPRAERAMPPPRDRRLAVPTPAHAPAHAPLPIVRMPGAPRYLPLALLAALALLVAAAGRQARRRSRVTRSGMAPAAGAAPTPRTPRPATRAPYRPAGGGPISSSMRRTIAAANAGVGGPLLAALKRLPPLAWRRATSSRLS